MIRTEFGLLGPVIVRRSGVTLPVQAGRQRAVLAALLVNANQLVTVEELAETLWGSRPPPSARVTVQNYVRRLRGALADTDRARISTHSRGYLIRVGADELDVTRFEALLRAAQGAARDGDWDRAACQAGAALALWRGEPLEDAGSELLAAREVPRLEELRLQALEARIGAGVHLGRQAEMITELRRLTGVHPLREHLHGLLMQALYRCGRQAEALAAYQQARQVLVSELGTEPGPALQDLHLRILRADPALAVPQPEIHGARGLTLAVPQQLPAAVRHFAGRAAELERLTTQLEDAAAAQGTVVITAIGGMAGVGKTALAVHWAHQVAGRFPDGQLYVNLRGFDPSAAPVTPEQALRGFLEALQVAPEKIPVTPQAQAGMYRTLLAGKKTLIILDNARDEQQVRPLLPATPNCLAVVTSRSPLAGLVAADGAQPVTLDVLSDADAHQLLARRVGGQRVTAEPQAVTELIGLCGQLPLALAIAAARAAAHPGRPLAAVAAELRDRYSRLAALDAGEPATSVRAVFSWSCQGLSPAAARMFRLLSLHPGPDITIPAAASLAILPHELSGELLRELARAGLLSEYASGRFTFHDLLRAYAAEQACAQDTEQQRSSALTSLFGYYLAAAATAIDAVFPEETRDRPQPPVPDLPVEQMASAAAGRDWLDAERGSLVAVTAHAVSGWPGHAIQLAAILHRYLETGGHFQDAQAVCACALRAARQTGDLTAQAGWLSKLAHIDVRQGNDVQAAGRARLAQELYHDIGDRHGQAQALIILGAVDWCQGRPQQSAGRLRQALAIFRETGERSGESRALANLGLVVQMQGHYDEAFGYVRDALTISRQIGNRTGEAYALGLLGMMLCRRDPYQQATEYIGQSLAIYRDLGNPGGEADALNHLGCALQAQARYEEAARNHRQAHAIFQETGNPRGEAESLNGLGEALSGAGVPELARAQHHHALILTRQFGSRHEQARAHNGLARTYDATSDYDQARHHWQLALTLYTGLGVPDADEVKAKLSTLPPPTCPPGETAEPRQ